MTLRYLSVCSGIEAATAAWHPLGWTPVAFSEIDPFPCAVLAHHYPDVPNLGDLTKYREWPDDLAPDLIVGGTPCQSFSVAGLRKGMADPRGNLALVFLGLVDRYRPQWVVWENVPGVRSSGGGRDFGAFLGGLGELGYGWAYRSLDAQYFDLAQRRERVFVVGHLGDWRPPAAVLFERESLSGHPAPRRTAGQAVAACLGVSAASSSSPNVGNGQGNVVAGTVSAKWSKGTGGYAGQNEQENLVWPEGGVIAMSSGQANAAVSVDLAHTLNATHETQIVGALTAKGPTAMGAPGVDGGHYLRWPAEVAPTLNAAFGDKQGLEDQHALGGAGLFVTHALMADGFDASEDGSGRGTPLVPMVFDTTPITSPKNYSNPQPGDACHPLAAGAHPPAVAFAHQAGGTQTTLGYDPEAGAAPTLSKSQTVAVAFAENTRGELRTSDIAPALSSGGGKPGQGYAAVLAPTLTSANDPSRSPQSSEVTQQVAAVHAATMAVRRLTPRECERLQGFPDDFTLVPHTRGKPAADGPRYKALGNSMAVPVMAWIGERIAQVDAATLDVEPS